MNRIIFSNYLVFLRVQVLRVRIKASSNPVAFRDYSSRNINEHLSEAGECRPEKAMAGEWLGRGRG